MNLSKRNLDAVSRRVSLDGCIEVGERGMEGCVAFPELDGKIDGRLA